MTNIIDLGRVSLDGYTGSILSQLKIRFNSDLLHGKRNEKTRKHLANDNVGIQYPPFGAIPDNKQLFVNFELLEEIVDPEYEVESVVNSDDDDDDDYVDENAEVAEEVIVANDQSSPVNSDKKRNGDTDDTDTTPRKKTSTQRVIISTRDSNFMY